MAECKDCIHFCVCSLIPHRMKVIPKWAGVNVLKPPPMLYQRSIISTNKKQTKALINFLITQRVRLRGRFLRRLRKRFSQNTYRRTPKNALYAVM